MLPNILPQWQGYFTPSYLYPTVRVTYTPMEMVIYTPMEGLFIPQCQGYSPPAR